MALKGRNPHVMNIAIEAFSLSEATITGIGNVTLNYLTQLRLLDKENDYYVYTIDGLNHISLDGRWRHILYTSPTRRARLAIRDAWVRSISPCARGGVVRQLWALILRLVKMAVVLADECWFVVWLWHSLRKNRVDVYVGTFADFFPLLLPSRVKALWLLHDLVWKRYPSTMKKRLSLTSLFFRWNMNRADMLVAISEATKQDAMNLLKVKTRIEVIPLAADSRTFYRASSPDVASVMKKYGIQKPYILSVCTLEPRKNLRALLEAYGMIERPERIRLVLVGMKGWKTSDLYEMMKKHRLADGIVVTGYVPSRDLAPLYSGASVFAFPSLYEGFGLPVLEAMQCGCPVITSNVSSLPEVAGDACILVDPRDSQSLAAAIERVLASPSLRRSMARKGLIRARGFSWERSARLLMGYIHSISAGREA